MAYKIITDSSCNLPVEYTDEFELEILPLRFMDDKGKEYQSYLKGQKVDLAEFYDLMRAGTVFTTSLPKPTEMETTFREQLDAGNDVIYLGFDSGISGTFEAANALLDQLRPEYPDRKIISIDTLCAAGGEGLIVLAAARMARDGATMEEVAQYVEDNKMHVAHWFTVPDLMYLFRGGRVSKTSAYAGTLLNIKPVLHVDDEGKLIPMEKVRGWKKALDKCVGHMDNAIDPISEQTVFISHGDCLEDAQKVADMMRERYGVKNVIINHLDPVIGAHTGPGLIAIFFMAKNRF